MADIKLGNMQLCLASKTSTNIIIQYSVVLGTQIQRFGRGVNMMQAHLIHLTLLLNYLKFSFISDPLL